MDTELRDVHLRPGPPHAHDQRPVANLASWIHLLDDEHHSGSMCERWAAVCGC